MAVRTLSKQLQERAKNELNEVPDRIESDIKQIREWLEKQPHLNARTDDQWLLNFLRCCKFSIQRTKERLDFFYTMRTLTPEFFENRDPLLPEIQDIFNRGFAIPLSKPLEDGGPLIFVVRWRKGDPEQNSYLNLTKTLTMTLDVLLNENDNFSVSGVIAVQDADEYPLNYVLQQTPAVCKKFVQTVQNAYPIRVKGAHFINVPAFVETLYNLFKPFLKEKLKSRIKLYGRNEFNELFKHVPLSALPKQYGGNGGCLDEMAVEWKKKIESYRDWFLEDAQYRSDETKRPGKPMTSADVFGIEGSFRKLDVD